MHDWLLTMDLSSLRCLVVGDTCTIGKKQNARFQYDSLPAGGQFLEPQPSRNAVWRAAAQGHHDDHHSVAPGHER